MTLYSFMFEFLNVDTSSAGSVWIILMLKQELSFSILNNCILSRLPDVAWSEILKFIYEVYINYLQKSDSCIYRGTLGEDEFQTCECELTTAWETSHRDAIHAPIEEPALAEFVGFKENGPWCLGLCLLLDLRMPVPHTKCCWLC